MTSLSEVVISCQGCIEGEMGIGGCLYVSEDIHDDTVITISDIESGYEIENSVQHRRERIYISGYQIYDVMHIISRMYQNLKNSWSRTL